MFELCRWSRRGIVCFAALILTVLCATPVLHAQNRYDQTNLVSDIPGLAKFTDPDLVNSWGIAFGPATPFWIADNGTGVATLYMGDGTKVPLTVTIPPPADGTPPSTPTGIVFNPTNDFVVSANGKMGAARFIFATEDGTISGWNPTVDMTHAILAVDNSKSGAVYKGLAIATTPSGNFIYATNFHDGVVEMYDGQFNLVRKFTDNTLPPNFAPFGIRNIGGKLFVTFALQKLPDKHDDQAGPGNGFVDIFDLDIDEFHRFASQGTLNSPWGLALATDDFGKFSGDLLVGNFGDGRINVFEPEDGDFLDQIRDRHHKPITIDGLWSLTFGNTLTPNNVLFFTAGPDDESHGLFGTITPVKQKKEKEEKEEGDQGQ